MPRDDPEPENPPDLMPRMGRREFLATSFLAGSTAALFAGRTGAGERPLARPRITLVFEENVFEEDVFL